MVDQIRHKKMAGGGEITVVVATEEEEAGEMTENSKVEKEQDLGGNTSVTVCKFFLEGRCRFGESCVNRHQGSPRVKPKETRKESKEVGRRRKKEKQEVE